VLSAHLRGTYLARAWLSLKSSLAAWAQQTLGEGVEPTA
jgi:hypothetical protein